LIKASRPQAAGAAPAGPITGSPGVAADVMRYKAWHVLLTVPAGAGRPEIAPKRQITSRHCGRHSDLGDLAKPPIGGAWWRYMPIWRFLRRNPPTLCGASIHIFAVDKRS